MKNQGKDVGHEAELGSRARKTHTLLDLSRFRKKKKDFNGDRKGALQKFKTARGYGLEQIDWSKVQADFLKGISQSSPEWGHLQEVLGRNGNDKERRVLLKSLGRGFIEVYVRYRNAALRRKGWIGDYSLPDEEAPLARVIVERCFKQNTHPVRLIEYWDSNIGNFTDLAYPTLNFLKGDGAIGKVSALAPEKKIKPKEVRKLDEAHARQPKHGNSFADLERLDPNLRRRLEAAGFKTQRYNDEFLLTVQYQAVSLAQGHRFFMAPGRFRRLVTWAARFIYRPALQQAAGEATGT